jgi:hypothetical protein
MVKLAIAAANNSSARGPNGLLVLHLKHLGPRDLQFFAQIFNISLSTALIPSIWKKSIIIPILKLGKPGNQGSLYYPISLLCPAAKILERLVLSYI